MIGDSGYHMALQPIDFYDRKSLSPYLCAKTRGCLSRDTAFTMVFKLCLSAEKRWRRLNGAEQMTAIMSGVKFEDGVRVEEDAA